MRGSFFERVPILRIIVCLGLFWGHLLMEPPPSPMFCASPSRLGCVAPLDDLELGITGFKARSSAPEQPALAHVAGEWFEAAWAQLPQGACLVDMETW